MKWKVKLSVKFVVIFLFFLSFSSFAESFTFSTTTNDGFSLTSNRVRANGSANPASFVGYVVLSPDTTYNCTVSLYTDDSQTSNNQYNTLAITLGGHEYIITQYDGANLSSVNDVTLTTDSQGRISLFAAAYEPYTLDSNCYCTFSFVIPPPPGSPPDLPSGITKSINAGMQWDWVLTDTNPVVSGTAPITYSISNGPSWLSCTSNVIHGICPVDQQNFSFILTASNQYGDDSCTVTVTVLPSGPHWDANPIDITVQQGSSIGNINFFDYVSGSPTITLTVTDPVIPPGLTLNPGMILSGTPTTVGDYSFVIKAENPYGIANVTVNITVESNVPVCTESPITLTVYTGGEFDYNLALFFSGSPTSINITGNPTWLVYAGTNIAGTAPSTPQTINMQLTATNSAGTSVPVELIFIVQEFGGNPSGFYFTSPSTAQSTQGQPFTYSASTNQSSATISMSNAPSFLSFNSSTNTVSGTPPDGITKYQFTLTATHVEFGSISMIVTVTNSITGEGGTVTDGVSDVRVINFDDLTNSTFGQSVNTGMGKIAQSVNNVNNNISTQGQKLKESLDGIKSSLDNLPGKLNTTNEKLQNIADLLPDLKTDVSGVENHLQDIKDLLNSDGVVPTANLDPSQFAPDKVFYNSTVNVPVFSNYLNQTYTMMAPTLVIPLSALNFHDSMTLEDKEFDFTEPVLYNAVQALRLFELGCVFIWCLVLMFKTIRTFEF